MSVFLNLNQLEMLYALEQQGYIGVVTKYIARMQQTGHSVTAAR